MNASKSRGSAEEGSQAAHTLILSGRFFIMEPIRQNQTRHMDKHRVIPRAIRELFLPIQVPERSQIPLEPPRSSGVASRTLFFKLLSSLLAKALKPVAIKRVTITEQIKLFIKPPAMVYT